MTRVRGRFLWLVAAALVAASVFVSVSAASTRSSARAGSNAALYPTLYVNYTDNCTFSIVNDAGAPVTAIPPGTYQVQVNTPIMFKLLTDQGIPGGSMVACGIGWVQFQLTGPNVDLYTTLTVGCDSSDTLPAVYFAPSSSFVAQDNAQPSVTRTTITTLASGSPTIPTSSSSGLATSTTSSGGGVSALGTAIAGKTTTTGSLGATVNASGAVSLTYKGKPVASLIAGSYTISVTNKSKTGGLVIEKVGHHATTVKGLGTHKLSLDLATGQWFFAPVSGTKKAKTYFIVTRSA